MDKINFIYKSTILSPCEISQKEGIHVWSPAWKWKEGICGDCKSLFKKILTDK